MRSALLIFALLAPSPVFAQTDADLLKALEETERSTWGGATQGDAAARMLSPCGGRKVYFAEDRFTGEVSVATTARPAEEEAPILLWASTAPDTFFLNFRRNHPTWRYLSCQHVALLVGGERVSPKAEHRGSVGGYGVIESLTVPLTAAQADLLVKSLEYRLCDDEFQADPRFLCEAKELLALVSGWKSRQVAKSP